MQRYVLAIDPGNVFSGYCLCDRDTYKPILKDKVDNTVLLNYDTLGLFKEHNITPENTEVVIEMLQCFGMPIGQTVLDTCVWVGRFQQKFEDFKFGMIYRKDEKLNLCHSNKANDSTIRQALADRFAPNEPNFGKGTKKAQGWFYGFSADMWSAYAVAVTYIDKMNEFENPF